MNVRNFLLTLSLAALPAVMFGGNGVVYRDALSLDVAGRTLNAAAPYHRIDTAHYSYLPKEVKRLYAHSTGLAISFTTDSDVIAARWSVEPISAYPNLAPIAQKGLDLYIRRDGKWVFAGVGKPSGNEGDGIIIENMAEGVKECLLYLPIYASLNTLEIGVREGASLAGNGNPFRGKIVVYGSSIAHGASASRAGMAYPARLSRQSGLNFTNMGISGNAKMQPGTERLLADIDADAFVLDCIPNPSAEQIAERLVPMVKYLREHRPNVPIILVQTTVRDTGTFNTRIDDYEKRKREATREAARILVGEVPGFYFVDGEDFIGDDHEGTADGVHPNDLGFDRMISTMGARVLAILAENGIAADAR